MVLSEDELEQKYLAGSIHYWLIVSQKLLKSFGEFIDSFFDFQINCEVQIKDVNAAILFNCEH